MPILRNPKVNQFFLDGCGRCPLTATPNCRVHQWQEELDFLRNMLLATELTEDLKWGFPCYTYQGKNVLMLGAFKESCTLSFMKGVLIEDNKGLLEKPGENSQSGRVIRFSGLTKIIENEALIRDYVQAAIDIEKKGLKVEDLPKTELVVPDELLDKFDEIPTLKTAFYALTPGRQRAYLIHFNSAKQVQTRVARIVKYIPKIFEGKGFNE